jgi:hypothetical protein
LVLLRSQAEILPRVFSHRGAEGAERKLLKHLSALCASAGNKDSGIERFYSTSTLMPASYRRLPEAVSPDAGQRAEGLSTRIAVLDRHGDIVTVNPAWERFALQRDAVTGGCGVGMNYLQACRERGAPFADETAAALDGIQSVLDGSLSAFTMEYSCRWPTQERWFLMHVTPLLTAQGARWFRISKSRIASKSRMPSGALTNLASACSTRPGPSCWCWTRPAGS